MARLRDPENGCPWDREQRFETIAPFTVEEAYEVADAVERGAIEDLEQELGDLLFQVVFHARIAEEAGAFTFEDVVRAICEKLTRRHPHVFGDTEIGSASEQSAAWESLKAAERPRGSSVLADVPQTLPALSRSAKLGKRASQVGFDWPDMRGARDKLDEEISELDAAVASRDRRAIEAEVGDVFFALVNVCRHLDVEPESATRAANRRFQTRFERVERAVRDSGQPWDSFELTELEALWQRAKAAEA